jgi:hypothetical protein
VITLRQAPPTDEMYHLIRTFAAEAESHGVQASAPAGALRSYAPGIGTTLALLVAMKVIVSFTSNAVEAGAAFLIVLTIAAWNAYAMLTDDDLGREDRYSTGWDARLRDRTRRLLGIYPV